MTSYLTTVWSTIVRGNDCCSIEAWRKFDVFSCWRDALTRSLGARAYNLNFRLHVSLARKGRGIQFCM